MFQYPFRSGCPSAAWGVGFADPALIAASTKAGVERLCATMRRGAKQEATITAAGIPELRKRSFIPEFLKHQVRQPRWTLSRPPSGRTALHYLDGGLPLSNSILRPLGKVISFKYPKVRVPSLGR